ncbi:MAG: hypothetical protein EOO69_10055 [Moraxellaceae bacterium]|nr:MAG: hypothetical protein EOO69_10055 [Moraxellaceae bacterium]
MITVPAILYPVLAFLFAVVVGRIGTIIMDHFRKDEMRLDAASASLKSKSTHAALSAAKHG